MVEHGLHVSRGSADAGSWEMFHAPVHPELTAAVNRLCGFAEDTRHPVRRTELPGPSCVLIVSFGSPYHLESPTRDWSSLKPQLGFAGGLGELPAIDVADGAARCVQVDLTPTGMYRLFGIPMSEIANRVVPIEDLFGASARVLAESLDAEKTWRGRLEIVQAELRRRLCAGMAVDQRVQWAWNKLLESGGTVDIGCLADQLELSRKHLIELFRQQVGLPPKRAARLIRFHRALGLASAGDFVDWSDLALQAGFFDQSHFINEVRRFSGQSPSDLFGDIGANAVDMSQLAG